MSEKKKVLVLGLGTSGRTAARFYASRGLEVFTADTRSEPAGLPELQKDIPDLKFLGAHPSLELVRNVTEVMISPGLSPEYSEFAPVVKEARKHGIDVVGEIELFARELKRLKETEGYSPKIIGITGTNGKTTTTMLSAAIIKEAGRSVVAAGNVGPNALRELDEHHKAGTLPDFWVLELSSFQLQTTESLHCDSAALLNITEDHIDWHGSMEKYAEAKRRIFSPDTVRVLNREDSGSMKSAIGVPRDLVRTFGSDAPKEIGDFGISDVGALVWLSGCVHSASPELLIPMNALRIRGLHNAMNALAATALTQAVGIPMDSILRTLREYKGEPHRVQLILTASGIDYVDDSKGTNVGAVVAALKGFGPKKVVLILGGDGKGQEFEPLKAPVEEHVKAAVFIGRDAEKIEKAVNYKGLPVAHAKTMKEAVRLCRGFAKQGDTILLSPACASWDMFKDYADRSAQFVEAAKEIAMEEGQPC